jgi:hypothetical protein
MVWTPEITGEFLDFAIDDELYALYHLIALRGLRRGEGCGLPRTNIDLTAAAITIDTQIIQLGWETHTSTPKSEASNRVIPIDVITTSVLQDHEECQQRDKVLAGENWHDTGLAFTHTDGQAWHPAEVSSRFKALVDAADLPPIRLHDLRHADPRRAGCQWPVCSPRRRPDVLPTDGQIDLPNGGQIIPRLGGTPLTATVSPPAPKSPARDGSCHLG